MVAFGDSTTALREGVTVYAERIHRRTAAAGWSLNVVNAGVRGNHTTHARQRFAADVLTHRPDVVIIQFGINDATVDVWADPPATQPRVDLADYVANLTYFVQTLQAQDTAVILCTPNPLAWTPETLALYGRPPYRPDAADGFDGHLPVYAQAMRDLAAALSVPLVDVDAAYRTHPGDASPPWRELLLDGIHPNDAGHSLVADLLWTELQTVLPSIHPDQPSKPA